MEATRVGDTIEVDFIYEDYGAAKAQAKQVQGGRKRRGSMVWVYPLAVDTCHQMRQEWSGELRVHKSLSAWYREAKGEHAAQVARAQAEHRAELTILPQRYPAFYGWLKPDQRVAAEWIANAYRNGGLLADEGGVGKTAAVVAGLLERDQQGSILIVCPKVSVKSVWHKEITSHSDIPCYPARGTRVKRERTIAAFLADPAPRKVLVVVAEMLRVKGKLNDKKRLEVTGSEYPELFGVEWSAIIVDEGHKLLGSFDVVRGNLAGEGLARLNYTEDTFRLCATATPWGKGGRVEALFGTLHWLWPDEHPSKWQWVGRFFEVEDQKVFIKGGRGASKTVKRIGGLKQGTDEQALYASLGPRVLRRTMAEVSPAHAGLKNWIVVPCEMEGKQERLYRDFVDNAEVKVEGGILSTTGVLDFYTRCRQLANGVLRLDGGKAKFTGDSNKVERLVEHLRASGILDGSSTTKVVVASQYNEFLDVVTARLRKEDCAYLELTGATSEAKREHAMETFQNGELVRNCGKVRRCPKCLAFYGHFHTPTCPVGRVLGPQVFVLNTKAGGVSITLDAADEMHVLDQVYPPEANEQLFWRIFRRGRIHQVFYYLYESEGTIDEKVSVHVAEGTAQQHGLLDGRRGIDHVRKLARYEPPIVAG